MGELERWEGRYAPESYLFGTAPNAFLVAQKARLPKHGRALSVADGEGRNGVWLAEQGLDVSIALVNNIKYGDRKSLPRGSFVTVRGLLVM